MTGCPAPSLTRPSTLFAAGWSNALSTLKAETGWPGWSGLITVEAAAGTAAWYALSLLLYKLLPANEKEGIELKSGGKLRYRMNCESCWCFPDGDEADNSAQPSSPL